MLLNVSSLFLSINFFVDIFQIGFQNFENFSLVILIKKILIKNACNEAIGDIDNIGFGI